MNLTSDTAVLCVLLAVPSSSHQRVGFASVQMRTPYQAPAGQGARPRDVFIPPHSSCVCTGATPHSPWIGMINSFQCGERANALRLVFPAGSNAASFVSPRRSKTSGSSWMTIPTRRAGRPAPTSSGTSAGWSTARGRATTCSSTSPVRPGTVSVGNSRCLCTLCGFVCWLVDSAQSGEGPFFHFSGANYSLLRVRTATSCEFCRRIKCTGWLAARSLDPIASSISPVYCPRQALSLPIALR